MCSTCLLAGFTQTAKAQDYTIDGALLSDFYPYFRPIHYQPFEYVQVGSDETYTWFEPSSLGTALTGDDAAIALPGLEFSAVGSWPPDNAGAPGDYSYIAFVPDANYGSGSSIQLDGPGINVDVNQLWTSAGVARQYDATIGGLLTYNPTTRILTYLSTPNILGHNNNGTGAVWRSPGQSGAPSGTIGQFIWAKWELVPHPGSYAIGGGGGGGSDPNTGFIWEWLSSNPDFEERDASDFDPMVASIQGAELSGFDTGLDLPTGTDLTEPPVWDIVIPFSAIGAPFGQSWPDQTYSVDFSIYAPVRGYVHTFVIVMTLIWSVGRVWQEMRRA